MAFDFFKKLIYEDDSSNEEGKSKEEVKDESSLPEEISTKEEIIPQENNPVVSVSTRKNLEINQDQVKAMEHLFEKEYSKSGSPDYMDLMKFVDSPISIKNTPSLEGRITNAFIMLQIQHPGLKAEDIINSITKYINLVDSQKESGLKDFETLWDREVISLQELIEEKEHSIEEIDKQIEELQKTKQLYQNDLRQEIEKKSQSEKNCLQKKEVFLYTFDQISQKLKNDKLQISKTLC